MAASDLKKPLGQASNKSIRFSQLFMFGSLGLLAFLLIGLASWLIIVDDPHGGFARETVELGNSVTESTRVGVAGIRPGIKPGIPETAMPDQAAVPQSDPFGQSDDGAQTSETADQSALGEIRVLDPAAPELNTAANANRTEPYRLYARPVNTDAIAGLPKIAIVVDGLGLSQSTTQEALSLLPPDVSLAFAPYGNSLSRWTEKARSQGHELLIQVPLEPFDYPNNDPGPHTLLTTADAEKNKANLNWILGRFDSYVGVMNYMGARFSSDEMAGGEFMRELHEKGLLYLDAGASGRSRLNAIAANMNVPNLRADLVIDFRGRADDIETRLIQLETIAQENGSALGVASAFPASVRTISDWTQSLRQRGFALVPITTLLQ